MIVVADRCEHDHELRRVCGNGLPGGRVELFGQFKCAKCRGWVRLGSEDAPISSVRGLYGQKDYSVSSCEKGSRATPSAP